MAKLTREQLKANIEALEKQGAKPKEIQEWLDSLKTESISRPYSGMDKSMMLKKEQAKGLTGKPTLGGFISSVPMGVAQTFKQIPRFLASTAELPKTLVTGKASQKTYDFPLFGSFQSYQTEAENIAKRKGALGAVAKVAPKVIVGGLETLGAIKGVQKIAKLGAKGIGGLSNRISITKESKATQDALEVITNQKLGKSEAISALKKTGKTGGVVEKGKLLKTFEVSADYDDLEAARAAQGIIKKGSTPTNNIGKLSKEISNVSTSKVRPQIQEANRTLTEADWSKIDGAIDEIQPNVFTKSNETAVRTFDNIKQGLKDFLKGNADDLESLYDAEIKYDRLILNESKGKAFEQISPAYEAVRGSRRAARSFLASQMKNPQAFLKDIEYEHNLFTAIEKIAEKNPQIIGKGIWKTLKLTHPIIAKGIKLGVGSSALYGAGKAIGGLLGK